MIVTLDQFIETYESQGLNQLIGLPTETVYGLAAPIHRDDLIERIFEVKKRPFFDPLIVHVADRQSAQTLTSAWPYAADVLAKSFWPGPLTLVLPKKSSVSDLITSGLPTIALRQPNHPIAQQILKAVGTPLAAPSANRFGKTSPTLPQHVEHEFPQDKILIVDGGPCEVGIESTILSVDDHGTTVRLEILRPGLILQSDIEKALINANLQFEFTEADPRTQAPGFMKHHYMPDIPLVLVPAAKAKDMSVATLSQMLNRPIKNPKPLLLESDAWLAARQLYAELRRLSESGADMIYFNVSPDHEQEAWQSVMDRLTKAATVKI